MQLNEALFELIHMVRNTTIQQIKSLNLELSPMHFKSLKVIKYIDNCTGQKLANFLGRDKAQINRLIKELVSQKLVIKTDNEQDKRSQLLSLTEDGEELIKQFRSVESEVANNMKGDISAEQIEQFIALAKQFKCNLKRTYHDD